MVKIILIKISPRNDIAPKVQEVLTEFGSIIKTRVGLHNISNDKGENNGVIILHVDEEEELKIKQLCDSLSHIENVTVKNISI